MKRMRLTSQWRSASLGTGAVPSLMIMALTISEESLARNRHTDTLRLGGVYVEMLKSLMTEN